MNWRETLGRPWGDGRRVLQIALFFTVIFAAIVAGVVIVAY